ncbi:hypothetical protein [Chengkuizengella axinellae]|uniref:DUF1667 domain-containing protein n=1 Tax=Chengkuizengella axinellae TaxID=3064388 RepID=A0ABT9J2N7_9BACL|nr:hypothetical protein [Chengkuizengella sp. 2205SS18-9]MDP5275279.1 hypothetical protein [Chengkuizengella sp. 2205SS18-9]
MGVFQKNICACCLCPMHCALKQFEDEEVTIFFRLPGEGQILTISSVENFVVSGISGNGNPVCVAISQIDFFEPTNPKTPADLVKPIRKSVKGECACVEDPITNKFQVGDIVNINTIGPLQVNAVGEGIVVTNFDGTQRIYSTCNNILFVDML